MATKKNNAQDAAQAAFDTFQEQSRQFGDAALETMQQAADLGFYFRARMGTATTALLQKHQELARQEQATMLDAIDHFSTQAREIQQRLVKAASFQQT
ncbi:MAG: hypothetical protein AAGI71_08225 [Bacteroidota bacterium]